MYRGYEPLIRYVVCKHSLPFCRLSFPRAGSFLGRAEAVSIALVTPAYFCFCCLRPHSTPFSKDVRKSIGVWSGRSSRAWLVFPAFP